MKKKKPAKQGDTKRATKDLAVARGRTVSGGSSVSNVLKTRHDTVKNSIDNIR